MTSRFHLSRTTTYRSPLPPLLSFSLPFQLRQIRWTQPRHTYNNRSSVSLFQFSSTVSVLNDTDLVSQLRIALKEAMKARDLSRRDVIKSVIGDIQTSQHLSNPPTPHKILKSAISKRLEAAKASAESNPPRTDLEQLNLAEVEILKDFLPPGSEAMTEEQLLEIVANTVAEMSLAADERQRAMGKVVKAVKAAVGDRADGKDVATAVKKVLELH